MEKTIGEYRIGDLLRDEDGNTGVVIIRWNDGDVCLLENDAAHPGPVITGNYFSEEKLKEDVEELNPNAWIVGDDTGISSKTIWVVMMGVSANAKMPSFWYADVPHDPADFGRCYRLLNLFPEWRKRLDEVGQQFPVWGPMIREWDKMTAIYERDLESGKSNELYNLMHKLETEGRRMVQTSF